MTEQKLRKFKLIDRDGYLDETSENTRIYEDYLTNGVVEGFIGRCEELYSSDGCCIIEIDEFKFFEEVFDEVGSKSWTGVGDFKVGSVVSATYEGADEWYTSEIVAFKGNGIACVDLDDNLIFWASDIQPIPEQTWQEKLCEEFYGLEYHPTPNKFHSIEGVMSTTQLVGFAKRIIELSEGGK